MHCYLCAARGEERPPVALCPNCQVGLCMRHAVEDAQAATPGGDAIRLLAPLGALGRSVVQIDRAERGPAAVALA